MKVHLIDTHLLVPRSRSSAKVKVKYQGHVSQKMGVSGAIVFHKHIFFLRTIWRKQICFIQLDLALNKKCERRNCQFPAFYPQPINKILDWSKLKQIADDISKCM